MLVRYICFNINLSNFVMRVIDNLPISYLDPIEAYVIRECCEHIPRSFCPPDELGPTNIQAKKDV